MMNKSRSWKRDEKHKAEDTVHDVEETRCIKRENNGSQGGLSAGRGRERRCQDSLGVRTPPTNVVHRGFPRRWQKRGPAWWQEGRRGHFQERV